MGNLRILGARGAVSFTSYPRCGFIATGLSASSAEQPEDGDHGGRLEAGDGKERSRSSTSPVGPQERLSAG